MVKDVIYRRGRSVVSSLNVHIIFVTKFRRGVFSERALAVLRASMTDVCRDFDAKLKEFNGEDDHVHLVDYPPTLKLTALVNSLKGVSSRRLRAHQWPEVTEKLWGGHLWSPPYFIASCGGVTLEILKKYIDGQRGADPHG